MHTPICQHRTWPAYINQLTSNVAFPHCPWPAHNDQPTSDVACQHRPWPVHISLPTSNVSCQRRLCPAHTDLPTSDVVWMQRPWRAHISQLTLDVACPHCLWFSLVRRVISHAMTLSRSNRQHTYAHVRCWRQTEVTAGVRHRHLVGLVGVLRGRLLACMACVCYAIGRLQKHAVIKFSPPTEVGNDGDWISLATKASASSTTFNVGCQSGCWVCIDEEIHVWRISGIRVVWLGWILASSSDNLSCIASRWWVKRNLGLLDVGLLCCIPYA
ncbi:hypothetical protein H5410_015199 [Solanum commersonii]|uniref:Uncharacterized protein n=1 Tax=Solanum commersonii TaxID=4109 RepID=A0A9J5ZTR8_SOLCO|nr:hypothetical protein H5410_015199 [Solanum commersonii]